MSVTIRKKSPRAPSTSLSEALDRALKIYEKERLHPTPTEVFAQNMGYKTANSGSALQMIASIRYFGLAERVSDGVLAISKDVESFKFAPSESQRADLLKKFLRAPALYGELLDKYASVLPSDPNLRYELIQRGFAPSAAESVLVAFRQSVEFAGYYVRGTPSEAESTPEPQEQDLPYLPVKPAVGAAHAPPNLPSAAGQTEEPVADEDRIPVRLPGGRRAWLVIPSPFFDADKARLKAQIDLLLTSDEEIQSTGA